jgi:hypothetical protein
MGDAMVAADGKGQAADGGFTPVMVRLMAAEVETGRSTDPHPRAACLRTVARPLKTFLSSFRAAMGLYFFKESCRVARANLTPGLPAL